MKINNMLRYSFLSIIGQIALLLTPIVFPAGVLALYIITGNDVFKLSIKEHFEIYLEVITVTIRGGLQNE